MTGQEVLVIDNYDSFVYNLVQYVGEAVQRRDGEVIVRRNDAIGTRAIQEIDPDGIIVSPGPGTPEAAGVSMDVFDLDFPTLGVCLGHQALCASNGAPVGHADAVVHGKPSRISHHGEGVFDGIGQGIRVGRYHSLAVDREAIPESLVETATTDDEDVVMAVRHREKPHVGVQFHPESILTEHGKTMIKNFLGVCREWDG